MFRKQQSETKDVMNFHRHAESMEATAIVEMKKDTEGGARTELSIHISPGRETKQKIQDMLF